MELRVSAGSRFFDVEAPDLQPGDRLQLSPTVSARIVDCDLHDAAYWVTVEGYTYPIVVNYDATVRVLRRVDLKR